MSDPERDIETDDGRLATSAPGAPDLETNGRVTDEPPAPIPLRPGQQEPPRRRVKVKKWRVLLVVFGLGIIAVLSTLFGMMMAVASGLPKLEEPAFQNSRLVDMNYHPLGLLTGNQRRVAVDSAQISPVMKQAIIAIEDRRFYTNDGVDLRGIGRALWEDVRAKKTVQGGSTITQQFVKTALAAQQKRSLFNKMREAALAYQITRKWSKQRILRNYLNTIYFGNGAYGIESAARVYFGGEHPGCERNKARPCAAQLETQEAALLAGIVQSPSAYDPLQHPKASKRRRDLVLQRMLEQGYISPPQHDTAVAQPVPIRADVKPPRENTEDPYFTSWVRQQVVDKLGGGQVGARQAFEGGLTVKTTLDVKLQDAAESAINQYLSWQGGPRASMVVLDNDKGAVRAMVGGDDYPTKPFNLATQGQRQPGSAFKPFVLAQALTDGISPSSVWASHKLTFNLGDEHVVVENYNNAYAGITTLARATTFSDNSVYVQVARRIGSKKVARLAREMGIRTPVSRNLSIALGGLRQGVTPIDMAHAYLTFANGGKFVYGTMSPGELRGIRRPGPVGIERITRRHDGENEPVTLPTGDPAVNRRRTKRILDPKVASTVTGLLQSVVKSGTGTRAQVADTFVAGKTGTTENYGDAWFVGWTSRYTVAIWVGYPDRLRPMKTEFAGQPVAGGTFPAAIFRSFIQNAFAAYPKKKKEKDKDEAVGAATPAPGTPGQPAPSNPSPAPSTQAPAGGAGGGKDDDEGGGDGTGGAEPAPQPPAEQPPAQPTPAPTAPPGGAAPAQGTG